MRFSGRCFKCILKLTIIKSLILLTVVNVNADLNCSYQDRFEKNLFCNVNDNRDVSLERGIVSDNNRTVSINLSGCHLQDINEGALNGLYNLEIVDLSHNNIRSLSKDIFNDMINIRNLNISYNKITELSRDLFIRNSNLEILDLKNNDIKEINGGTFDKMTELKELDLSQNNIIGSILNEDIFKETRNLKKIVLSGNDFARTPDGLLDNLSKLEKIYLEGCFLKEIPPSVLKDSMQQLKYLSLATNEIDNLENGQTFRNLISLEILNLSDNLIVNINENVFKPLTKLKTLQLRSNMIKELPETVFQNIKKLGNIDLSHNKIEFIPVNAFRGTSLKNLNLSDNKFSYLVNNFCLELSNSGAKLSKLYFNQNPWQCACLQELLAEVKKYEIEYNSEHFNGKEAVCTSDKDYNRCKRHAADNTHFIMLFEEIKNRD